MGTFRDCFETLPDPRTGNAQQHDFLELLLIAIMATLCGAESCVDFELFARSKQEFLREFLTLEGGVPSHDNFSRLFRLIDAGTFAGCLQRLAQALAAAVTRAGIVAIDGKGLRTALASLRGGTPLALVNAFASASGLALGQIGVPAGTSEIAALRELLALLDLKGKPSRPTRSTARKRPRKPSSTRALITFSASRRTASPCMMTPCSFSTIRRRRPTTRPRRSTPITAVLKPGACA